MTFLEKFKADHPGAKIRDSSGIPFGCPYYLGYEEKHICRMNPISCETCWNREMPTQKTMLEKFFEMFPSAEKDITDKTTPTLCPSSLGWGGQDPCKTDYSVSCIKCWSRDYEE